MLLRFVINSLLMILCGLSNAGEIPKASINNLEPDKGTEGYDVFFYDGQSLRDEKWRNIGSSVSRRIFRDLHNFHLVDAAIDALGSLTKSYKIENEKDLTKNRAKELKTQKDGGNIRRSGAFEGVTFNTQYSSHNGYPQLSNIVGIQHQNNIPNSMNGLNRKCIFKQIVL